MPLMPVLLGGKIRLVDMPAGASSEEQYLIEEENLRRISVARSRMYYEGSQYDVQNLNAMSACGLDPLHDRLPEHERIHAYATQVRDSIDFIADQIAESFALE